MTRTVPAAAVGLALWLAAPQALAGHTDLTPCQGLWKGTGEDPWDPGPYEIELLLTGGTRQCATVTYVDMCTTRWVNCEAKEDWVRAEEQLVDPGNCAPGTVEVRCIDPDELQVRWEGEPGVMTTTLHRATAAPAAGADTPPRTYDDRPRRPSERPNRDDPTKSKTEPSASEAAGSGGGCGCSMAWLIVPGLRLRRRRLR